MANPGNTSSRTLLLLILLVVLVIGVVYVLNLPDQRSGGEKIGDAIDNLSEGDLKNAGRALEDRTPGERLKDTANDIKEDVKDGTR